MNQTAITPNGQLFRSSEIENGSQVTPILITPKRITLAWPQDGKVGHLDATSKDGIHFHGHYGYAPNDSDFKCELTLYQAHGEQLLFGTWWENGTALQGVLAFRLPTKVAEPGASRPDKPPQSTNECQPASEPQRPGDRPATGKPRNASDRQPTSKPSTADKPRMVGKLLAANLPQIAKEAVRPTPQQPLPRLAPPAPTVAPASRPGRSFAGDDIGAIRAV